MYQAECYVFYTQCLCLLHSSQQEAILLTPYFKYLLSELQELTWVQQLVMTGTINPMSLASSIYPSRYLGTQEAFHKSFPVGLSRTVQVVALLVTVVPTWARTHSQDPSELDPGLDGVYGPALQGP